MDPTQCGGAESCIKDSINRYSHENKETFSYEEAREHMFQEIDTVFDENGRRTVQSVYTNHVYEVGSRGIPKDGVNTEHTWPQSKLKVSSRYSEARTDLYHLFPCQIEANSMRGNSPFVDIPGEPHGEGRVFEVSGAGFEPPEAHKGIVARAMLYVSIEYRLPLDDKQEAVLRKWAKEYPVLEEERERAQKIQSLQGNRNPFIEHPEWIDLVKNF
jgi:endonuclease I